ncbi:MAG: ABC transporter ATP-binding protein [Candidatus Coatesbacteria bacterium]|nr:ABC transporter ATP-binding protein [Candidatus Coatesbacteria bacterium]
MAKMIEASGLKKHYRRGPETVKALNGVDFEISSGEIVAIVGPSGSGKTTLMNLISCLDSPTEGKLSIAGQDVTGYKEKQLIEIRRKNIGFVFQRPHLIPTLTARENVELPIIFSKRKTPGQDVSAQDVSRGAISSKLGEVGLKGRDLMQVRMLSGGDMQLVAIARALVLNPRVLIADEPTGRFSTQVRDTMTALFKELAASGLAVFIATHDLDLAERCDRMIHLQDGVIVPKEMSSLYA